MLPEVLHGPVTTANSWRVADRAGHVSLNQRNRLAERASAGQVSRQRCGERASGAVRVRALDTLGHELMESVGVEQEVADVGGREMAAFDDHCGRAERLDSLRGRPPVLVRSRCASRRALRPPECSA